MNAMNQTFIPANIEAEHAILGALMMNNDALDAIPSTFDERHFYEPFHQAVYGEIKRLIEAGKNANPVTVKAGVDTGAMIGGMTISQYLSKIASDAVSIINVPGFAAAITFDAMRRGLISVGEQAGELGFQCGDELSFLEQADALKSQLERIVRGLECDDELTLADAANRALNATNSAYKGSGHIGVDYGFGPLVGLIGPAMPGQLIVIGGGTKQGKSTLIEQIVMGAAINGHPVWVYSGEMQGEELAHRALSRITDIQAWRQIRGKVSEAEVERLMIAKANAESWQKRVVIRDKPMTLTQIERSVTNFTVRHPGGMAIIDHIGLVERDKSNNRLADQDFGPLVTRTLKMLANKAALPIFAAAQLKKNTFAIEERNMSVKTFNAAINRRPKYADILGSVEKDANHVIIPFRAEPILQEIEPAEGTPLYSDWESVMSTVKDKAEIILALSRHTRWPQRKEVGWNGGKTMFTELNQSEQGRML
jgi:replicative DNA helicase